MGKIVGLFSGQGAQYPGMGKELYENFALAKEVYQCGADILGWDIGEMSFTGSPQQLGDTLVSQPAIFAHSVAAYTVAKGLMPPLDGVAGHSLGEYAALYAGGAFSLEDGFRIIGARAQVMHQAGEGAHGAMTAILRSNLEAITAACAQAGGLVEPVNLNLPDQTVISGETGAVARAVELLTAQGARAMPLGVSSAFHTSMMAEAADQLVELVGGMTFHPTTLPFFSNLTGGELVIIDYPAYFAKHMVSPVRFVEEMAAMTNWGATTMVEFGPKKTVSTLAKKNGKDLTVANVEDLASLRALEKLSL